MSRAGDGEPEPQTETKCRAKVPLRIATARGAPPRRIGSVSARCTGTVKREADQRRPSHQHSRPNEKNERKKELAANAIDRPNTI